MSDTTPFYRGVRLVHLERLALSAYGNPAYRLTFEHDGNYMVHRTQANASIAYAIGNSEYRDQPVDVWLSKRGSVTFVRPSSQ